MAKCVKDFKNDWAISVVEESNKYCIAQALVVSNFIELVGSSVNHQEVPDSYLRQVYLQKKLCPTPFRLVVVNRRDFGMALDCAYKNLNQDNFMVSILIISRLSYFCRGDRFVFIAVSHLRYIRLFGLLNFFLMLDYFSLDCLKSTY